MPYKKNNLYLLLKPYRTHKYCVDKMQGLIVSKPAVPYYACVQRKSK
jgi:hypothetical protein